MDKRIKKLITSEQEFYTSSYKNYFIGLFYHHERFFEGRYLYHLRMVKYYESINTVYSLVMSKWHRSRLYYYSLKTGLQLESNIGFGIKIYHFGWIIINGAANIGNNLTIYPGVTIGQTGGCRDNTPTIGNDVTIYQNAMICGKITIGDNVTILANPVVTHDVAANSIVGGVPSKVIRIK